MQKLSLLGILALLVALALLAGCERKVVNQTSGTGNELVSCFTCHGDDGLIIEAQGEWQNSVHASGTTVDYANRASYCPRCHTHQGFLDYLKTGSALGPYTPAASIHCFTCHAPHENGNLNVRVTTPVTMWAGNAIFDHGKANLCASCHQALMAASSITDSIMLTSNRWGPHHGTQGDMINGTNGYEFAGFTYEQSPHATVVDSNNPCIGCHMAEVQQHDAYKVGGHSWNMTDEVTGSNLVAYCDICHDGATDYNIDGAQETTDSMLIVLRDLLVVQGVLALQNGEYLPNVPRGDTLIIPDKNIAGALFNWLLVEADRSEGVHNFKYISGLLESSIQYLEAHPPIGKPTFTYMISH